MTNQPPFTLQPAGPITAFEPTDALQRGYLLVDPGALPEDISLASLAALPCTPSNWGADLTGVPVLLDLAQCEPSQRDWLHAFLRSEHTHRKRFPLTHPAACAHITATASCSEIATHLAQQLLITPVDKTGYRSLGPCLWRLFDPRIFANLCWMLDQQQQHILLGPISAWAFPWFDQWFSLKRTLPWPLNQYDLQNTSSTRPRPVDMALWERAQRIAQINQVLARLPLPQNIGWEIRALTAQRIECALTAAKHRLHWSHSEDQMGYAESATRYGKSFLEHPKLVGYWKLREERKASGSWSDAANVLTAEDYRALHTEHSSAHHAPREPALPSENS